MLEDLNRDVTFREEIVTTIRRFGNYKPLGLDGFQAIFYKSQWQIIGDEFCDLSNNIFGDPQKVEEINGTLISLIPKKDVVVCLKDFHPISLCNVSYKIVIKINVLRSA